MKLILSKINISLFPTYQVGLSRVLCNGKSNHVVIGRRNRHKTVYRRSLHQLTVANQLKARPTKAGDNVFCHGIPFSVKQPKAKKPLVGYKLPKVFQVTAGNTSIRKFVFFLALFMK